jgi:hypothetical protein
MIRAPAVRLACCVALGLTAACSGDGGAKPAADAGWRLDATFAFDVGAAPEVPIITTAPPDGGWSLPPGFVTPPPPRIACDGADGGPTTCDIPPSACASAAGCDGGYEACLPIWFVFYENPRCVAGWCVWDEGVFPCTQSFHECREGACVYISPTN